MILTTTTAIEGHTIREYKGVVFGEVITGVNFLKDFAASIRNFVGGRSGAYENELVEARQKAMNEMEQRTRSMGANAVVGISFLKLVTTNDLGRGSPSYTEIVVMRPEPLECGAVQVVPVIRMGNADEEFGPFLQ
ncbi:MAG: YbjQ family protein [Candidatus Cryptobacteroides sp.]